LYRLPVFPFDLGFNIKGCAPSEFLHPNKKEQHFGPFGILYTFWLAEFYTFLRGKKECKHMIHSMHDCFEESTDSTEILVNILMRTSNN